MEPTASHPGRASDHAGLQFIRPDGWDPAALAPRPVQAVIVHLDMVGYSRLIGHDVVGTLRRIRTLRDACINPLIGQYDGNLVQTGGDSLLLTFQDVPTATGFALALQTALPRHNSQRSTDGAIRFRVGIDMGEVFPDGTDLHGNGVNIATRLQSTCPPGGISVSRAVHDRIPDPDRGKFASVGSLNLKNIPQPVEAFIWRAEAPLRKPDQTTRTRAVSTEPGRIATLTLGPSIAVLPFRMMPADADDAYFADGVVEDIIHALAAQKEMFVISRSSTLPFTDPEVDRQQVASELGVRYMLHGSIRRAADTVRIRTELTDTESGQLLRSDQYDGNATDLFAFQEKIAIRVAATIAPQVRERELRRAMRKPPDSLTAYDLVLKALDNLYRLDSDSFTCARPLLRRAIRLDPDYAPTHSYLAYWHILQFGEGRSKNRAADVKAAAQCAAAALSRDSSDALALAIYGHVLAFMMHDFPRARDYLDRALRDGPNCAMAWSMSSTTHGYLGQPAEAVRHAQRGLLLSPLDAHMFWHEGQLAQALYLNGQYEEAIAMASRVARRHPHLMFNLRVLIVSLQATGQHMEAQQAARQMMRAQPDFSLATYRPHCPFQGVVLENWIGRLRAAGAGA